VIPDDHPEETLVEVTVNEDSYRVQGTIADVDGFVLPPVLVTIIGG